MTGAIVLCIIAREFQKQSIHVSRRFQTNLSNRNKNWYPQWQPSDKVFDTKVSKPRRGQYGVGDKGALKLKTMLAYIILWRFFRTCLSLCIKCWGFQRWHTPEFVYFECFEVVKCHLVSSHPNVLNLHKHCGSFFRLCAWVPRSSIFWAKPQIEQCLASDDSAVVRPWIMKCTYLVYMMYIYTPYCTMILLLLLLSIIVDMKMCLHVDCMWWNPIIVLGMWHVPIIVVRTGDIATWQHQPQRQPSTLLMKPAELLWMAAIWSLRLRQPSHLYGWKSLLVNVLWVE